MKTCRDCNVQKDATCFEVKKNSCRDCRAIYNYGLYDPKAKYHIDHVIPCASAKTKEELIRLQHYTNLQYLYPLDNIIKTDKLNFNLKEIR